MSNQTLYAAWDLPESELAELLEREFDSAWFPQYHRCSVQSVDATVYVDFDAACVSRMVDGERRDLAARLGFVPRGALHVSPSIYHAGSPELAEQVFQTLSQYLDGSNSLTPPPSRAATAG